MGNIDLIWSEVYHIAKLKDNFNIEILVIDISTELKESSLIAQKRQYR